MDNLEVTYLDLDGIFMFSARGSVNTDTRGFQLPKRLAPYKKTVAFILGFSGGLFSSCSTLFLLGIISYQLGGLTGYIALTVTVLIEFFYGIWEAFQFVTPEKLMTIHCVL